MLRISHLAHPLRAIQLGAERIRTHRSIRRVAAEGWRRYKGDSRYDVGKVHVGAERPAVSGEDAPLLKRICEAYRCAVAAFPRQGAYAATSWWEEVRENSLGPVRQALADGDLEALQGMYANFYRDSCSNGLIGLNLNISKDRFLDPAREIHRRFQLADALYRIDYWQEATEGRYSIESLAGPGVGNPFGLWVGDVLAPIGAEQQHYYAQAVAALIPNARVVAEIGGGFGGMAYYLLRDNPRLTYMDFDVPESLALTAYFLMKAFPERRVLLFGEGEVSEGSLNEFDVVLMPSFELPKIPGRCVDVTFTAHILTDLAPEAQCVYVRDVQSQTRGCLMQVGADVGTERLKTRIREQAPKLEFVVETARNWNAHREAVTEEIELIYRVGMP